MMKSFQAKRTHALRKLARGDFLIFARAPFRSQDAAKTARRSGKVERYDYDGCGAAANQPSRSRRPRWPDSDQQDADAAERGNRGAALGEGRIDQDGAHENAAQPAATAADARPAAPLVQ